MSSAVALGELPGRGTCLLAVRDLRPGETVLVEPPVLLYAHPDYDAAVCARCLRALHTVDAATTPPCGGCRARFCGGPCAALAASPGGGHTAAACRGLALLRALPLGADDLHLARFLLHAYSAGLQHQLLRLAPGAGVSAAHSRLAAAAAPSLAAALGYAVPEAEAAQLLAREAANGFCVMAPDGGPTGDGMARRVRGTGLYLLASRLNHGCFPNVARFDAFDAPGEGGWCLQIRAMDPIPAGSELLLSYFPISLPLAQRQARLRADYGFECACARCSLEAAAAASMAGGAMSAGAGGVDGDDDDDAAPWEAGGDGYDAEYSLWFLKFLCPVEGCGGTLAPPMPTATTMLCNYCGAARDDAEFWAALGGSPDDVMGE